jgi:hypothetical protein
MDIRLITVKEDFEKAFNILNHREYPLSYYEYVLKHDQFHKNSSLKLIGVFEKEQCIGTLSYLVDQCPHLDRVLHIKEIYQTGIKGHKKLMEFIDILAKEENCRVIKISKKKVERLQNSFLDRFEGILKNIIFH